MLTITRAGPGIFGEVVEGECVHSRICFSTFKLSSISLNYTPDGGWRQSICLVMKGANVLLVKSNDCLVHRELNNQSSEVQCNVSFMVNITGESCI